MEKTKATMKDLRLRLSKARRHKTIKAISAIKRFLAVYLMPFVRLVFASAKDFGKQGMDLAKHLINLHGRKDKNTKAVLSIFYSGHFTPTVMQ